MTFEREWYEEERRHLDATVRIVAKYPAKRMHVVYAVLGSAVAAADTFGVDVEEWLAELRSREPLPAVLVPPKGVQS